MGLTVESWGTLSVAKAAGVRILKSITNLTRAALGLSVAMLAVGASADGIGTHLGAKLTPVAGVDVHALVSSIGGATVVSVGADGTGIVTFPNPANMKAFTVKAKANRGLASIRLDAQRSWRSHKESRMKRWPLPTPRAPTTPTA